jgi:ribosome maturation factor RimP
MPTESMNENGLTSITTPTQAYASATPEAELNLLIESILAPMGFELVATEVQNHREKKLRIFIDLLQKTEAKSAVDIEDCVRVTHALDQPLEGNPIVDRVITGAYDLEVSSPGVERPLRKPSDYDRFAGSIARINTFRPLTAEETQASEYSTKNPKQKNFYGFLRGYQGTTQSIQLGIIPEDGTLQAGGKAKAKAKNDDKRKPEILILIPIDLVAKAHLEPIWE